MKGNAEKKKHNADVSGVFEKKGARSKKDSIELVHFVYEAQLERMDTYIKTIFILCLILIVLLFGTNVAWFAYKSNAQIVDTSVVRELDNTGKMIALKPIYYTTDYEDDIEIVFQSEGVNDNKAERSKKKFNVYYFDALAVAC